MSKNDPKSVAPAGAKTIPEALARLLCRVALDGERIAPPRLSTLASGTWGEQSLDAYRANLSVRGQSLSLRLVPKATSKPPELGALLKLRNQPLRLTLADGMRVEAPFAHVAIPNPASPTVRGEMWFAQPPGRRPPRFWVGPIAGAACSFGNLSLRDPTRGRVSSGHLRVEGHYAWHVVRSKHRGPWAVIDAAGSALDPERARDDFLALQLALGVPLDLGALAGLDEAGRILAASGFRFGRRRTAPQLGCFGDACPVPPPHVAAFARCLALALSDQPVLRTAVAAYLDTVVEPTIDGSNLKLHVALEAISGGAEGEVIVKDPEAWTRWVRSLESQIREHALADAWKTALVDKVISAKMLPSSSVVIDALSRLTPPLVLGDAELKELRKRNIAAHNYVMNKNRTYVVDRDVGRIDLLKTVLIAITARRARYVGPICGWVRNDGEIWRSPPVWWTFEASEPPAFHAERPRGGRPPSPAAGARRVPGGASATKSVGGRTATRTGAAVRR